MLDLLGTCTFSQQVVCLLVVSSLLVWCARLYSKGLLINTSKSASTQSKCVVITGCDSGFGRAFALEFARLGFTVFATCLTAEGKSSLEKEWTSQSIYGSKRVAILMDVTCQSDVETLVNTVTEYTLSKREKSDQCRLWAVINNAGIMRVGEADIVHFSDFEQSLNVNVLGPIRLCKQFLPLLRESSLLAKQKSLHRPRIVNICSASVLSPMYGYSAYVTSKSALYAFSTILRSEITHSFGIHVSTLLPGAFATDLLQMSTLSDAYLSRFKQKTDIYGTDFMNDSHSKCIGGTKLAANKDVSPVVNAMKDAVLREIPYERYIVGIDAWALWFLTFLPDWLGSWLASVALQPRVTPDFMKRK